MAVFPEGMNRLDVNNVPGSLSRIENYIRYMTDRMEFAMRNMTRNVSDAGMSSVEVMLLLKEMANTVSVINSTVQGMQGDITALSNRVTQVQNAHTSIAADITALRDNVTKVQNAQAEMNGKIINLQSQITALTARVADLEGGTEGEPNGS